MQVKTTNIGTLSDFDIKNLCSEKKLIEDNFDIGRVKQACYELRAGYTYYDISNNAKKHVINNDNYILIKPKQTIAIITYESLYLPNLVTLTQPKLLPATFSSQYCIT